MVAPPFPPLTTAFTPQDPFDEKSPLQATPTLAPPHQDHGGVSPTGTRDQETVLTDEVELQRAERLVSTREQELASKKTKLLHKDTDREDSFGPDPTPTKTRVDPEKAPDSAFYRLWLKLKKFPRFFRYFVYLLPGALLLLIPLLIDHFALESGKNPVGGEGGVYLLWFCVWLEIVWCTLWVSRMITCIIPSLFKAVAHMFGSNAHKKWKDVGRRLELHAALFLWMLAVLISFKPTVNNHRVPVEGDPPKIGWISVVNKVIISVFVLATLNLIEKVIIQWIATTFHQRTYSKRIQDNKKHISTLVALYEYAKKKIPDLDDTDDDGGPGTKTPMQAFSDNARQALSKVGGIANKVGNDFIGRKVDVNHPRKVVQELLRGPKSAHSLARILFRALRADESKETVVLEDLRPIFDDDEEVETAFQVFDKDLNGDISMAEFEGVCNEIHLEKKAISASMKDLDSVIKKLDSVFMVIVVIIAIIVFVSIISGSAAATLGSAGTAALGLAWVLQATAQEFLQSIIFVFVKHPFDVGDRVTIYGNTGVLGRGDDYYVTEISLLYTEFKKMEGHIVQAPNSTLNTLFILNQRRSNGLADPVELKIRFGTTEEQINELKARMLDFLLANKRDYHTRVLTEIKTLDELRSATMNFVFFHKSSFQNELLRLARHNRFVTELMRQMVDIGIQGPLRNDPGGSRDYPLYWQAMAPPAYAHDDNQRPDFSPYDPHGAPVGGIDRKPSGATAAARSRVDARMAELTEDSFADFQDVYSSRREPSVSRVRSVRSPSMSHERRSNDIAMATGPSLDRTGTMHSNTTARRFWSRNRAGSRAPPPAASSAARASDIV